MRKIVLLVLILTVLLFGCVKKENIAKLEIKSVFPNNGEIPKKYTCDGENISPPLEFGNVSKNAKSIAIVVEDLDARKFTHWIIYNIPPTNKIPENIPKGREIERPFKAMQGKNDFGYYGYGGPCPPSGVHRYVFQVFVLDKMLENREYSKKDLLKAMEGHIIQKGVLIGKYHR